MRQQLKEILQQKTMGFSIRSRFKENVETEKASLFHINRENKNFLKNNHEELKIDGIISNDKKQIEDEILKYYEALFNGHHNSDLVDTGMPFVPDDFHLEDFLSGVGKLSSESQASLVKELSFEDVEHVIKHECDYNKSPGLDGLPYEIYKATWDIIGKDFVEVLKVQMNRFRIIESDKHGATRL